MNLYTPSQLDLAWAAGIIDGEGSIGIRKVTYTTRKGYTRYAVALECGNTDIRMLKELQKFFGGSINSRTCLPHINSKPLWTWTLGSKAAYLTISQILPYLRVKRERAELAIHFYESCRDYKYTTQQDSKGRIVSRSFRSNDEMYRREELFLIMRELNKRGNK